MSNLCLTHAAANKRDPFNQSHFAGVPDSIRDRSDDDETTAEHGHYNASDNGTDSENADDNGTDSDNADDTEHNNIGNDADETDYYDQNNDTATNYSNDADATDYNGDNYNYKSACSFMS